jgi:hypothetical protein
LNESRSGLEENAARTAAQVERSEILHCLSEQGNLDCQANEFEKFQWSEEISDSQERQATSSQP